MAVIGPTTIKVNGSTIGTRGNLNIAQAGQVTVAGVDVPASDQATVTVTGVPNTITAVSGSLNADVTLTSANTFFDGPSCSVTAGTWLVAGGVTIKRTTTAGADTVKLWDGSTVVASSSNIRLQNNNDEASIHLSGIYVAAGSATLKISSATTAGSNLRVMKAAVTNNGAGNNACFISAIKIA